MLNRAGFVLTPLKWRSRLGEIQWEQCLSWASHGRHIAAPAAAEQSLLKLRVSCFLLTYVAKVGFFVCSFFSFFPQKPSLNRILFEL